MNEEKKQSLLERLGESQVWKSIIRSGVPRGRRQRMYAVLGNVFLHLHPARLPKHAVKIGYTWCMGGLSFFLFVVLTITGILLMFYYRPTVEYAYTDIIDLTEQVPLGIMRELHRWGAHAMVLTVWLHMLRVFMTGSYKPPREFNWGVGVLLMTMTLFLSFTGYLLPWDQLAFWAVTVGTNMARATPVLGHEGPFHPQDIVTQSNDVRFALLGGPIVGPSTLLRFYILHCVAVPLLASVLMALHFWRVRKDGGISGPL